MRLLCLFTFVFALAKAQQITVNLPKAGDTIQPGQTITVQLIAQRQESLEGATQDLSLAIGIASCGVPPSCPSPSSDLGTLVFTGKYVGQGPAPTGGLSTLANFTVTVPSTLIAGQAVIQVQRNSVFAFPGHASPTVSYSSLQVQVQSSGGSTAGLNLNIHPDGNNAKCVGILGGVYADGTAVDIFDCNASATQKWKFNGNSVVSTNPADGSNWCLDAGLQSTWHDGLKMKIWQCLPNLPQQTWTPINTLGALGILKLTAPSTNFCLDLTGGVTTNQNVLQMWTCFTGNTHQLWSVTSV